jgi:hypothetical protein
MKSINTSKPIKRGAMVYVPQDILAEIQSIKVDTGVHSTTEALRIAFKKLKW